MNLFEACPKIYFGENALDCLRELPREKVLVVTDPFMVSSGMLRTVTARLEDAGIACAVFSEVEPDPSIETVAAGLQMIFHEKPATVIALGGGSAIDACKAMLYFCVRVKGAMMDSRYVHRPSFIAIPTTSGTGSEVTSYAVVSDRQRGVKIPLTDRLMIPDVAILDPDYTRTLPGELAAFTGMDVLTHAVEAYVSDNANDFTDLFALDAARMVFTHLPAMVEDRENCTAREKMFTASTMAGLAFTNSGLGLCHGIAHTLGGLFHIPHGKANAIVLPHVIAFNAGGGAAQVRRRYAALACHLGLGCDDDRLCCRRLVEAVRLLGGRLAIPRSLGESGVDGTAFRSRMDEAAGHILEDVCTQGNPVPVTRQDVLKLLEDIYEGREPEVRA